MAHHLYAIDSHTWACSTCGVQLTGLTERDRIILSTPGLARCEPF